MSILRFKSKCSIQEYLSFTPATQQGKNKSDLVTVGVELPKGMKKIAQQ